MSRVCAVEQRQYVLGPAAAPVAAAEQVRLRGEARHACLSCGHVDTQPAPLGGQELFLAHCD